MDIYVHIHDIYLLYVFYVYIHISILYIYIKCSDRQKILSVFKEIFEHKVFL